jgi:type IV secretion system protein VirB1
MHKVIAAGLLLVSMQSMGGEMESLLTQCVPSVHPSTMGAIIRTESRGNAYALSDDGPSHLPWRVRKTMLRSFNPGSLEEAVRITNGLISDGHIVGLGLAQVNSRNLAKLGLTVEQALDPCTNLNAGGQILTNFYLRAFQKYGNAEKALIAAISAYNTGSFVAGIENGYVGKVVRAGYTVPPLRVGRSNAGASKTVARKQVAKSARPAGPTARDILNEAKNSPINIAFESQD